MHFLLLITISGKLLYASPYPYCFIDYFMPYIALEDHLPGITGLLEYSKGTAQPIRDLTQFLLRGPSTLTEAERELIATVVSFGNECTFCTTAHTAVADLLAGETQTAGKVKQNIETAPVSEKMKALLTIAKLTGQIETARNASATDTEIHDTVLIAAAFCMFNRYVDGLDTWAPQDRQFYVNRAPQRAQEGYQSSIYK